jgi:uncharacterized protein involved in exopolysaccharide biosynthesis
MKSLGKEYYITYHSTYSAAAVIAGLLHVVPKSAGTGIINITMLTTSSQMGADIINDLMEEYSNYTKEVKNKTSDQMLDFIDGRIGLLSHQLDSVQKLMLDYMEKNNIIDIEDQSSGYFEKLQRNR